MTDQAWNLVQEIIKVIEGKDIKSARAALATVLDALLRPETIQ